ncbi:MAG: hypothetical protein HOD06_02525 [Candidatus Komeilibacteria bacterium]|jgi:hypothetical protein|nr:hypothetical protein [Candidatus Komeilibacteria bacterium]
MPKIKIQVDIQKDAWNWWYSCNKVSHGVDWKNRIDESIWENIHGKTQEQAFEFLVPYLKNYYIKKQQHFDFIIKQAKQIFKDKLDDVCQIMEKVTQQPLYRQDFTFYLTTFPRCPYDYASGSIWLCTLWSVEDVLDTFIHELLHFQVMHYYKDNPQVQRMSLAKFEDLKESLTIILNYEFNQYLNNPDMGYAKHRKLREKLAKFWQSNKDFAKLIEYGSNILIKNQIYHRVFL